MTIPSETNRSGPYSCNGATTSFPYAFKIYDEAHIRVILTDPAGLESDLMLGTDYAVSGAGSDGGGAVTTTAAYAAGNKITLVLNVPFTQSTDLENQGAYFAETIERSFDLLTQQTLQLRELVARSVVLPVTSSVAVTELVNATIALAEIQSQMVALVGIKPEIETVAGIAADVVAAQGNAQAATAGAAIATTKAGEAAASALAAAGAADRAETAAATVEGVVSYAVDQDLTTDEKARAQANLGLEGLQNALTPFGFTATAGQTAFALGMSPLPSACIFSLNGSWLTGGGVDYTVTGSTLTLATPAEAGDRIAGVAIAPFTVANAMLSAANLADLANVAVARANLGITPATMAAWAGGARGHIFGLTMSYVGATTFSVALGEAASEGGTRLGLTLSSSLTKGLSAWAAGTGAGSLDTGAIAANTWYHVHLIATADGVAVDVLLSLSATAPTMPAGYTARRRIGSLRANGSSQITPFVQLGDDFFLNTPVNDVVANPIPTTATLYPLSVPSGVRVTAHLTAQQLAPTSNFIGVLLTSPDTADVTPGAAANPPTGPYNVGAQLYSTGSIGGEMLSLRVRTDTSGRIRVRANAANSNPLYVYTYGWTDDRGRLQ